MNSFLNSIMNKANGFMNELTQIAGQMNSTTWAVLSVASVIAGYFLLKGNGIKGS